MASQMKITGFFRPTKPNSSAAASKRRKAIVVDEDNVCKLEPKSEIKPTITTDHQPETSVQPENEPSVMLKSDVFKVEPVKTGNSKNIFTDGIELGKSIQKKTVQRKSRKSTKSIESSLKKCFPKPFIAEKLNIVTEITKGEATSFSDNHDYNPVEVSTPKGAIGSTTSCRKRKMQCVEEQSDLIKLTPEKPTEKVHNVESSKKVRKKLEMGDDKVSAGQLLEGKADLLNSPSKTVAFLCLGHLSPRKPQMNSPIRTTSSPSMKNKLLQSSTEKRIQNLAEKSFKSSAVRSLSSLLDKAPPTKLTPEEVKSRLGNSKNLAELRSKLSKVNDCSAKVKEFYENKVQLKKFSNLEFNLSVPVSPGKSPSKQSPITRERRIEKRPAFERFHALAQPPSEHLVLPYKYKVLNEVFRCLETVIAMLYNRKECIHFNKVKPAVQKMLQRDFTEKHLAQVCHVFPSAYKINYERLVANLQSSPVKNRSFQLILAPRLNYLSPKLLDEEEDNDNNDDHKSFVPLAPTMLIERRYIFHNRLIKIVKEHHTEFLAEYNPLLKVSEEKVTRWHQNFDVDAIPEVPAAGLPAPPDVKTFSTAKDVLEQAHNLAKLNPRLEAALKERVALKDADAPPKPNSQQEAEPPKPVNVGLKGVSQSLIDKIRAREAAKASKQMTMNTEEIRRQGILKLLPELARIINSIYVTEKKSVLPLRPLIEKIQYSHRGIMSASAVEEHIRLLRGVYPEWLDILNRGGVDYVKVDRKIDSNIVYQKLEDNAKS